MFPASDSWVTSLRLPVFRESLEIPQSVSIFRLARVAFPLLLESQVCDCQGDYFRKKRIDTRENPYISEAPDADAGAIRALQLFGIRVRSGAASKL
jgi:hypothetical protein